MLSINVIANCENSAGELVGAVSLFYCLTLQQNIQTLWFSFGFLNLAWEESIEPKDKSKAKQNHNILLISSNCFGYLRFFLGFESYVQRTHSLCYSWTLKHCLHYHCNGLFFVCFVAEHCMSVCVCMRAYKYVSWGNLCMWMWDLHFSRPLSLSLSFWRIKSFYYECIYPEIDSK